MRTETTQYECSHGRTPKGYGMWALVATGTDGKGSYTSETYFITGNFGEARKQAAKRLKQDCGAVKTVTEIAVLP